jgi:thiol-disulfide isomerase/thioredoxin
MKKLNVLFVAILSLAIFAVSANAQLKPGYIVENFKLSDSNGVEKSFNDLKGKNGTIVVFLSVQCPVVKSYNERISKISEDYAGKGIKVIGINSNYTETVERIKKHTEDNYKFTVLIDKGNVIADSLNANSTPEIFFFDKDNKLAYHGGIDNDRTGENVTMNFLRDALDSNLAGKAIAKAETRAIGCTIKKQNQ